MDAPGVPEVRHFVYRVGEQFTAPRVGVHAGAQCPYRDRAAVKQLMRRYQSVHARVHALPKPLREYLQVTDRETIFAWTSAEYELYVAFGPLASKPSPSRRPTGCSAGSRRSSRACSSAPQAGDDVGGRVKLKSSATIVTAGRHRPAATAVEYDASQLVGLEL